MTPLAKMRCALALLLVILTANILAAQAPTPTQTVVPQKPILEWTTADHASTIPLRDMAPMPVKGERHEAPPVRVFPRTGRPVVPATGVDTALQTVGLAAPSIGNVTSFAGVGQGDYGYSDNVAPPDTNLAVGATQVVQWVNTSFGVFSKTGTLLAGPTTGNTLYQALGPTHPCAVNNDGDIIAQYDKAANRWVLAQLSVTNGASVGYWECVAVSQTSDATGAYNVYGFSYGTVQFDDYPKIGIWNNAYLATYNIFNNGQSFAGPKLCAFDRASMLAGAAATQVCFQLSTSFGGVLPSDLDGSTPPPAGSPAFFVDFGTNDLELWQMSNINFSAGTATLTGPITIPVAAFAPACNGGGTCIPQLGTNQLVDSLADRLMYRLAYRNFGDHEALVVNHSIDNGGPSAIRWYEVRSPGSSPTLFQQGTFAPDSSYRWMGSAAMDHAGNIAVGYSVSSSSINPAIRFTGRAPSDPLGTLGTEISIKSGTGSQNGGLTRWGDYSSLSVDPVDDCTLWYTTEYLKTNGSFNWSTEIANFKFSTCGNPDYTLTASPASQSVTQGNGTTYTATVTPTGGFTAAVALTIGGLPAGASGSFNPTSITSGNSTLSITTSSTTPTGSYPLTITGTSGSLVHTASVTLVVTTAPTPDFSVTASPASQSVTQGNNTTYTTTITPSGGFTGTVALSASGMPAGATASFNPGSITTSGNSTLTITTSSTTPTGSFPLTITGTSGSLVHTASVTLVVTSTGDFSVTASPASQTVTAGNGTSYTATATGTGGFSGSITFTASGLPSGASASFNPNPVTGGSGSSTMSVTTSTSTAAGTYTVTITGTSGSLQHSTAVTLVVNPAPNPDFTISDSPSSITVTRGSTGHSTVTIGAVNGFTGTVSLSASGQGSRVTTSFNPTSVTRSGTSTLSVRVSSRATRGTRTLTITGTSGGLRHSTTLTLTIQ
jgi:hypothetical protein